MREQGRKCLPIQADLANSPISTPWSLARWRNSGKIDILVNNAGVTKALGIFDISESDWDWMHSVNLKGLFFCLQRVAREMARQAGDRQYRLHRRQGLSRNLQCRLRRQ